MPSGRGSRFVVAVASCALVVLWVPGCAQKVTGVGGGTQGTPASAATLRSLESACEARALGQYRSLFTGDYTFQLSPGDSMWSTATWSRDDELQSATHLFAGGNADQPPAVACALAFDRILVAMPDPQTMTWDPDGRWHVTIRTHVELSVRTSDGQTAAFTSTEHFSLVRGDSAVVPAGLGPGEFPTDSLHWYLRRWEELAQGSTSSTMAATHDPRSAAPLFSVPPELITTWGRLKLIYW